MVSVLSSLDAAAQAEAWDAVIADWAYGVEEEEEEEEEEEKEEEPPGE